MKFEEIKELLQYTDGESKIYMPNEIFEDLKGAIKNSPHISFSYSYVYLVHWLYRHTKYINSNSIITNEHIKEILGYNAKTKGLDYLIKKNGLLDEIGYTLTTNDVPLHWNFDKFEGLTFSTLQETIEEEMKNNHLLTKGEILQTYQIPRKYNVKFPVKAFDRYSDDDIDGTYYDISNTHLIPFEIFMYCMGNDEIGTTGFYLYSYLKTQYDKFPSGYDVSLDDLAGETGISRSTIGRYIDALKKFNIIRFKINQEFVIGLPKELRLANTYYTNDYSGFKSVPQEFIKRKVIHNITYFNRLEEKVKIDREVNEQMNFLPSSF